LVSVVIPLYNRSTTILTCIESALNQSYPNIEVVVVDDGSTDSPLQALSKLQDPRVRLIHQMNQGACAARNNGIDQALGEYVALLDSDDAFFPDHLAESVARLTSEPLVDVVYGKILVDRGHGRTFVKPPRPPKKGQAIGEYLLCDQGFIQTSTVVLKRELAAAVGYKPGLRFGQDTDFAIRLASKGAVFFMLSTLQAKWSDEASNSRVSSSLDPTARMLWLDSVSEVISSRARTGDEGWYVAKSYLKRGNPLRASYLYCKAVLRGCYRPALALRIAAQIFLPTRTYRRLADWTLNSRRNA